jgi:hypothetical protein
MSLIVTLRVSVYSIRTSQRTRCLLLTSGLIIKRLRVSEFIAVYCCLNVTTRDRRPERATALCLHSDIGENGVWERNEGL